MKKRIRTALSLMLALCLLLSVLPGSVLAVEAEETLTAAAAQSQTATQETAGETTVAEATEEVTVIREEESLRGEYEKHFLMSDGSYQAVVYSYPVHELVDGTWVEIDYSQQTESGITTLSDVSPDSAQTNIIDNYVWEGYGVQDNNAVRLYIGNKSGAKARAFIQFSTMPTIPEGATITSATMTVNIVSGTSTANEARAYMVTGGEWTSGTIQWSNMPEAETILEDNISHNEKTKYQFSCLTAVQHWYDGDTTGQNENYGIMLRYADETIADYNSFYSADCTDASSRPSLTISYDLANSTVDVDKGSTLALSVTGTTGTVTWASSDTSIATVDSSGVVTGVELGKTTITAYDGDLVYKTFTLYVTVMDGVYRLRNNVSYNLGTSGSIMENTEVFLTGSPSSELEEIRQRWKITYLGGGYYSIRPLYKLDMALHADGTQGSSVDIVSIGTSDTLSAVPVYTRWGISTSTDGDDFYISHVATSYLGLKAEDGAPVEGMGVTIANNTLERGPFEWSLELIEDPPSGVIVYDTETDSIVTWPSRHITVGSTITLADIGLAVNVYSGGSGQMVWSKESGTSCLSINQTTGAITGIACGTSLVTGVSDYGTAEIYITVTGSSSTDFTFINHYDSTFLDDPELIGYIGDAVSFVNECYQRQFGVTFSSLAAPYYRENNIVDSCPMGSNVSCHDGDTCGSSCNSSHHKNKYNVADALYSNDIPENHVVVFWTNHDLGTYCEDGGASGSIAGVYEHRPLIHMMVAMDGPYSEEDETLMCMSLTLAHEFTHTLGMDDLYDNPAHGDLNEYTCVMMGFDYITTAPLWDFYEAVNKGDKNLFCPTCEATLKQLLSDATS